MPTGRWTRVSARAAWSGRGSPALSTPPDDLLVQGDGKIVVAGEGDGRFALLRLNPDGSADTSFGPGGDGRAAQAFRRPDGAPGDLFIRSAGRALVVRLMPDGRLVAAGSAAPGLSSQYALARFNPDGTLDATFANGGTLAHVMPGFSLNQATALSVRDDGGIAFAVESASLNYNSEPMRVHVLRLRPDGSFDVSFGDGGAVDLASSFGQHAGGVALLPDGKVLVAGGQDWSNLLLLQRLLPSGAPDVSFGSGGMIERPAHGGSLYTPRSPGVHDLLLEPDGDATLVASPHYTQNSGNPGLPTLVLARFKTDSTIAVSNTPPTVSVSGPSARPGVEYSLALNYTDAGADAVDHWTIDWGDGTPAETVPPAAAAKHTYAASGAYSVVARAVDDDGTWPAPPLAVRVVRPASLAPDGTLTVEGSPIADAIALAVADGVLSVTVVGLVQMFDAAGVARINVVALDGADAITVGAGVRPAGGINVAGDGGDDTVTVASDAGVVAFSGGAGTDTYFVDGSEGDDVVRLTPGTVTGAGGTRTFADVETLRVRTLGGVDSVEVALGDVPADGPFPATFVDAGNGDDRIDVAGLPAGRTVTVGGGLGHDAVNILPGSLGTVVVDVIAVGVTDAVTFMGTDGDDTFEIASRQVKQGDRSVVFQELPYPVLPWAPFTLSGGAGNDRFIATAPVPRGMVLDGGDGDDRFEFQPLWAGPSFPQEPVPLLSVFGGPGLDTVVADSRATQNGVTYFIADAGIGRLPRGDAERLSVWGGSGADIFQVTPGVATITVAGNDPPMGAPQGDRLMMFTEGAEGRQFQPAGDGAGRYTFSNRGDVEFSGVEYVPEFVPPTVTATRYLDTTVPVLVFKFSEPVTGLSTSLTIENLATGVKKQASNFQYNAATDEATFGFVNLPDGQYRATLARGKVTDASGNRLLADAVTSFVNINGPHVAGRQVFYNNSALDGNNPAQNAADDGAVAADKRALLPGQAASFANVVGSAAGINGVMLDLARVGTAYTPRTSDFSFFVSDASAPGGWRTLPAPAAMTFRRGAGDNGTDRVTFTWPDGTVRNAWLRVVVSPANTRLATQDVFSFGNLVGETGDARGPLRVTALDLLAVRRAMAAGTVGPINPAFDFNHDGRVNALDLAAVRANLNKVLGPPTVTAAVTVALSGIAVLSPKRVWDDPARPVLG